MSPSTTRRRRTRSTSAAEARRDELTLEELAKELDSYSFAISTQLRTINLGILGLTWLLIVGDEKLARITQGLPQRALLGIALACILALVLDLAQYLLAERAVEQAFDEAAESDRRSAGYDETSWAYRGQLWSYRCKLVLTFGAAAALIAVVSRALI